MKSLKVLFFSAAALAAGSLFAETETVNGVTWTYHVEDGEAIIGFYDDYYYVYGTAIPTSTSGAITIPSKLGGYPVTSIGNQAFYGCSGLTSVTIPDGVTNIGRGAFWGCSGLTSVTIPKSVASIENAYVFAVCSGLMSFEVAEGNSSYKSVSGLLLTKDGKTLVAVPGGLTSVTIPDGVTNIGDGAFIGCSSFFRFSGCSGLTSVTIPDGVTNIGRGAFSGCSGLASVTIPKSVKSIGKSAFTSCGGLISVTFLGDAPDSVEGAVFYDSCGSSVNPGCVICVGRGSTGWGVKIPGAWNGLRIEYVASGQTSTVTYKANGGWIGDVYAICNDYASVSAAEAKRKVQKGKALGVLPVVTRVGYTFKGWYTKKSGGSKIKTSTKVKKNVTYYAQWTANKYKIKFNKNGGKGTMKTLSATYGKSVKLTANAFKKSNCKFAGWATKKGGKVKYKNKAKVKNLTYKNGESVTLYAVWNKKASSVESAAKSAKAVSAAATVPAWAAGVFYGGDEESLTAITVSASGKVSGKIFFASETWSLEGVADGRRIDAMIADADGGSRAIGLVITELEDGRCRIESEDGLIWAEKGL